jgi:hypothetical protein
MRKLFLAFNLTAIANEPLENAKFGMEVGDKDRRYMNFQQLQTCRQGEILRLYIENVTKNTYLTNMIPQEMK